MSLESMRKRLEYCGGAAQQDRMIQDKFRSMLSATKNSYQAAHFKFYPSMKKTYRGLFNSLQQNMDYDTKRISIPFETGFKTGEVFYWEETKTFWINYIQEKTELAYFKGLCRRCDYEIQWVTKDKELKKTYAAVIGPSSSGLKISKEEIIIDRDESKITLLVQDNKDNHDYFNQYNTFLLKTNTYKITGIDDISMPGVIEIFAEKTPSNRIDDDVEENIRNKWNVQPIIQDYPDDDLIRGLSVITPLFDYEYSIENLQGEWYCEEIRNGRKLPLIITPTNDGISLRWDNRHSGKFTLVFIPEGKEPIKKNIIVESLM